MTFFVNYRFSPWVQVQLQIFLMRTNGALPLLFTHAVHYLVQLLGNIIHNNGIVKLNSLFYYRPIVGGYLNDAWGWRSNFWFICIAIFVVWVFILVFLPETWRPAPVLPDSPPMTKKEKLKLLNPLRSLMFFKYPNIALSILFVGVIFMMFYFVNTTFTRTYTLQYGFDSGTVGLCYLPLACGGIVGSQIGGRIADSTYNKRMAAANGNVYPEMRLNLVLVGSAVFTQIVGFLLYGWSVQKNVHFSAGLVAQFICKLHSYDSFERFNNHP